jgi:hypothetical protein
MQHLLSKRTVRSTTPLPTAAAAVVVAATVMVVVAAVVGLARQRQGQSRTSSPEKKRHLGSV